MQYSLTNIKLPSLKNIYVNFTAMNAQTGKYIIVLGAVLVVAGIVVYFFHDKLRWIGRLPGDIRIENENSGFYFPITTMLLLSLLVSGILWVIKKL